ncbi:K(+)-transporting ATPase subunit C [Lactococcus lactis]|uniref:Potassium-transporting ATPase KdpC subunit n=1 Tax=Lactococcus lactis TaxID=1358 RepID=A0A6B3RZC3_9LACT|nr:K(+)-transporting ATPase subunit C [Lactococcus lactis]MCT1173766.1 K(+)-transporting ATPase subunit C [Lactococcus lactis]NEX50646.1 K(+)-transporting ATPase subunit C [Lactococcus lactis]NEX53947.1 K(+)-transporting ATPase subunit C [Lactococcus lactis]NEX54775.1 K(+)-transporting ATPase subunit C [Lactococcus lactis]
MRKIFKELKTPFLVTVVFTVICGLFYPLLITGLGQSIFPYQANGSLIVNKGKVIGSELIGQQFSDERFMKGRPSAVNYNTYTVKEKSEGKYLGVASGSQNLSPSNSLLKKRVESDIKNFLNNNPSINKKDIPTDLLTSSGSGLDPSISQQSALVQIPQISKSTGISEDNLKKIIDKNTQNKILGFLGEKTVNVLKVNLEIYNQLSEKSD